MNRQLLKQIVVDNRALLVLLLLAVAVAGGLWQAAAAQEQRCSVLQTVWNEKRRQHVMDGVEPEAEGKQLTGFLTTIPFEHEFPRLLGQLQDRTKAAEAVAGPMTYKTIKTELNGMLCYRLHGSARGEYPALKKLAATVQQLDGLVILDRISIAGLDPQSRLLTLEYDLTLHLREGRP